MSTDLRRDVNRTLLGNVAAKSVFIFLGDEVNAEGYGWPGVRYIASSTEVSLRTVRRMMQVFEEIGLIEKVDRGKKNGRKMQYGTQIALEKLGTDLRAEFAKACASVRGSGDDELTIHEADEVEFTLDLQGGSDFPQGPTDRDDAVPRTANAVPRTAETVPGTVPPHPLIGVPITDPLRTQPPNPRSAGEPGPLRRHSVSTGPTAADVQASLPWGVEKSRSIIAAVDQVMQGSGFTARRLRTPLRAVIEQEWDKGEHPPTTALAMIAAWRRYQAARPQLATGWSTKTFFAEGHWQKPESWPYSQKALDQERLAAEARTGSYHHEDKGSKR